MGFRTVYGQIMKIIDMWNGIWGIKEKKVKKSEPKIKKKKKTTKKKTTKKKGKK